jgi:Domain of unknown function (DUF4347)
MEYSSLFEFNLLGGTASLSALASASTSSLGGLSMAAAGASTSVHWSAPAASVPITGGAIEEAPRGRSETLGPSRAVAFIDTRLDDYQRLAVGLAPNTEVWLLNPLQDEVSQITQVLTGYRDVTSLSIFSHGSDGSLQLGLGSLDQTNLASYTPEIQTWARALAQTADIQLYGCNVAASLQGQSFVQQLSQITGADVGASSDLTGSASLGGNWTLEYWTGQPSLSAPLSAWTQATYNHLLATFAVTNVNDSGAGSLRQAIIDANGAAGADVINFTGLFTDTAPDIITLTSGQLEITGDLTISGTGAPLLTISGNNASRVFQVNPNVNAAIGGVTITQGKADVGGGVLNNGGSLAVVNSTFSSNVATQVGGGLFNSGAMLVNGGSFISNSASLFGGGIYNLGGLEARNSTFNLNQAQQQNGGAILNEAGALLTVDNNIFSRNTAGRFGGGIHNSGGANLTVTTSTITNGTAGILGGGIANFGTLNNLDNTLIRGNQSGIAGGGFYNGGTANVNNTSILNNTSAEQGGGIYNDSAATLTVRANSLVSGNRARGGGGIYNLGTARVGGSSIISNRLTAVGSGPDVFGAFISEGLNTIYKAVGSTGFSAASNDTIIFG